MTNLVEKEELFDVLFMLYRSYHEISKFEIPNGYTLYQLFCGEWLIAALYFLEVNADAFQLTENCLKQAPENLHLYDLAYPEYDFFLALLDELQLVYKIENNYKNGSLVMIW